MQSNQMKKIRKALQSQHLLQSLVLHHAIKTASKLIANNQIANQTIANQMIASLTIARLTVATMTAIKTASPKDHHATNANSVIYQILAVLKAALLHVIMKIHVLRRLNVTLTTHGTPSAKATAVLMLKHARTQMLKKSRREHSIFADPSLSQRKSMYADGKRLARIQTEKNKRRVYVSLITNALNAIVVIHAAKISHATLVTIKTLVTVRSQFNQAATTVLRASLDIQDSDMMVQMNEENRQSHHLRHKPS